MTMSNKISVAEWMFVLLSLMFFSGIFTRTIIGGELTTTYGTGVESWQVQALGGFVYSVAFFLLVRRSENIVWSGELIIVISLVAYAFVIASVSMAPEVSIRKTLGLLGATLFALYFAFSFTAEQRFKLLFQFSSLFILLNLMTIFVPSYAFHQITDRVYFEHAGRLRALFFHKNDLARVTSITILIYICVYLFRRQYVARWLTVLILSAFLVIFLSGSAQTAVALPIACGAIWYFRSTSNISTRKKILAMVLLCGGALYFILPWADLIDAVLAMLGRDSTLSNRTLIWRSVLRSGASHWLFGGGLGVAWQEGIGLRLKADIGSDQGQAHNGFIQAWLELGVVGIGIFAMLYFSTLFKLLNAPLAPHNMRMLTFDFGFIILYTLLNLAGSNLIRHNDLLWMLFVLVVVSVPADLRITAREGFNSATRLVRRSVGMQAQTRRDSVRVVSWSKHR